MTFLRDLFGPGTWGAGGNLIAWIICGALGAGAAWLFRDHIGRGLVRWWHKHHQAHLAEMAERDKPNEAPSSGSGGNLPA